MQRAVGTGNGKGCSPPSPPPAPRPIPAGRDTFAAAWLRSASRHGAPGLSAGMGSGAPDANAKILTGSYGKSVIFALKEVVSIQASGAFFMVTSDFEVFHLALEL